MMDRIVSTTMGRDGFIYVFTESGKVYRMNVDYKSTGTVTFEKVGKINLGLS